MSDNVFKRFMTLLPGQQVQVGDVVSISGGVATVELPGGGLVQARGEASIGDRVFLSGGSIDGPAPDLPYFQIEI